MASRDDYLKQPLAERLARLAVAPDDLAAAIDGRTDAELSRRAPDGWSAKEAVCHLRDVDELSMLRFHTMLASDDPKVFVVGAPPPDPEAWGMSDEAPFPLAPERWAEERQYQRNDTLEALAAFRRRRGEMLAFLNALTPLQRKRASLHPERGRTTFEEWTAGIAGHDDNHLAQILRALGGDGA